ncbi:hypothetical protein WI46_15490 [Burkholderia ubonensis]|nr:hypothetical protein WI43_11420 [Burkholderia ubonensis]KVA39512.1 hypothetical protein WI46_15490 [Burkholderia ubonensis]
MAAGTLQDQRPFATDYLFRFFVVCRFRQLDIIHLLSALKLYSGQAAFAAGLVAITTADVTSHGFQISLNAFTSNRAAE